MESISTIEVEVKNIDLDIVSLQKMITGMREEIHEAQHDEKIRSLGSQIRFLESERENLAGEYNLLMRQGESRVKLGLAREKIHDLQKQIEDQ
jgi:archaellum component FlaC